MESNDKIKIAFAKMLASTKVEITKQERLRFPDTYRNTGRWFDILCCNSDNTIDIVSPLNHCVVHSINLRDIKF